MKLTLPAFFTTDESKKKEEIHGYSLLTDGEIRRIVLYNVNSVSVILDDDGTVYTHLFDGGTAYIIPLKFKAVEELVDLAKSIGFADGFKIWKETREHEAN